MKKGQIHFIETIFVLLILVIIIFIGIIITYFSLNRELSEKKETLTTTDAIILTDSVISMPEFTCGKSSNCIDTLKIFAFQQILQDPIKRKYYSTLFGKKRITLQIIYPEINAHFDRFCSLNDFHDGFSQECRYFLLYGGEETPDFSQKLESSAHVYIPSLDKRVLGILTIEVLQ